MTLLWWIWVLGGTVVGLMVFFYGKWRFQKGCGQPRDEWYLHTNKLYEVVSTITGREYSFWWYGELLERNPRYGLGFQGLPRRSFYKLPNQPPLEGYFRVIWRKDSIGSRKLLFETVDDETMVWIIDNGLAGKPAQPPPSSPKPESVQQTT